MLWQQFVETRTMAVVSMMQGEIQQVANDYFKASLSLAILPHMSHAHSSHLSPPDDSHTG